MPAPVDLIPEYADVVRVRRQLGLGPLAILTAMPWAAVSDSTVQALGADDFTPQQVTFNTVESSNGITVSSNAFTIVRPGTYLLTFSTVVALDSGNNKAHNIWLRLNGSNIARSNTHTVVANAKEDRVTTVTFLLPLINADVLTLWQSGDSTNLRLYSEPAVAGAKGYPASPSIIITLNYISP